MFLFFSTYTMIKIIVDVLKIKRFLQCSTNTKSITPAHRHTKFTAYGLAHTMGSNKSATAVSLDPLILS